MDPTISAAWIQAGAAIALTLFSAATGWLFYQINMLHKRISDLRDFSADLMHNHEIENRDFREDVKTRLGRIEGNGRRR